MHLAGTDDAPTVRAHAHATLRAALLDGDLAPGQKLVERELCELTGASRSVLREALVHLEASGLIERRSYRGFNVVDLDTATIGEIFELRRCLEPMAAELFTARAGGQHVADLRAALTDLAEAVSAGAAAGMRIAKERYYAVLFSGCRNSEITRALENVMDRIQHLRGRLMADPVRRVASLDEMTALTEALVDRDAEAARTAALRHLDGAHRALIDRLDSASDQQQSGQQTA